MKKTAIVELERNENRHKMKKENKEKGRRRRRRHRGEIETWEERLTHTREITDSLID